VFSCEVSSSEAELESGVVRAAEKVTEKDSFESAAFVCNRQQRERESNSVHQAQPPTATTPPSISHTISTVIKRKVILRNLICLILTHLGFSVNTNSKTSPQPPRSTSFRPSSRTFSKAQIPLRSTSISSVMKSSRRRMLVQRCLAIIRQRYKDTEWTRALHPSNAKSGIPW